MRNLIGEKWFESALGQHVLATEQALYDEQVGDIFGFNAVQIGLSKLDLLTNCRIPHLVHADMACGDLRCDHEYLPFAESCIDLLCLPHALEFSDHPHQTLREAARVLVPEGHLLLTGFNPVSLWGIKYLIRNEQQAALNYPWNGQFFSISRIKDWLALLGLELVEAQFFCYRPPINDEDWLHRLVFMERIGKRWWPVMGGLYFIKAKKRVVNMTLLKPNWKKSALKSRLVTGNTPKRTRPTQKKQHE